MGCERGKGKSRRETRDDETQVLQVTEWAQGGRGKTSHLESVSLPLILQLLAYREVYIYGLYVFI